LSTARSIKSLKLNLRLSKTSNYFVVTNLQ